MPPEQDPWAPYIVGNPRPASAAGFENTCQSFSTISHVTHIENAISILKKGKILTQLVYDESILNQDRILVNWLSPNYWAPGFRYGNVMLDYDFEPLFQNKNIYWVERMDYSPKALRFLITSHDRSSDKRLKPYDPRIKQGPWWFDEVAGIHYRNGDYTLEFMVEDGLDVVDATSISFVDHHADYCCIDPKTCLDKKLRSESAAGYFAAGVALHGLDCEDLPISADALGQIQRVFLRKWHQARDVEFAGGNLSAEAEMALARAWLGACYFRRKDEQASLKQLFPSRDRFFESVRSILDDSFGAAKLRDLHDPENADY